MNMFRTSSSAISSPPPARMVPSQARRFTANFLKIAPVVARVRSGLVFHMKELPELILLGGALALLMLWIGR